MQMAPTLSKGLSPLARGNPNHTYQTFHTLGTIPARAGEPMQVPICNPLIRDYPRSRGGTSTENMSQGRARGLSPLARGNQSAE